MPLSPEQESLWRAMDLGTRWTLRPPPAPAAAPPRSAARAAAARPAAPGTAPRSQPDQSRARSALADPELSRRAADADWDELSRLIARCRACPGLTGRVNPVPGLAAPPGSLAIVGEAPGRDEDLDGQPFVGRSGRLLDSALSCCGLARGQQVAVLNLIKCRPPNNRDPWPEEAAACRPFLARQLALLRPRALFLLGRHALHGLVPSCAADALSSVRGRPLTAVIGDSRLPAVATYHPAYLLRNPRAKEQFWRDLLRARGLRDTPPTEAGRDD